jgi:hypothetical protein
MPTAPVVGDQPGPSDAGADVEISMVERAQCPGERVEHRDLIRRHTFSRASIGGLAFT